MFNDKKIKSVAEEVSKIMHESLKGNQYKIDANKNNKVDAQDFKMLRAGKKVAKEEVEKIDEIKIADLPKRTIKGKSYGADYEDPEGKDDADEKQAQPEKRGRGRPKGTFKRRYNTKVYTEQFSHLINSYKTGGLKSIMEDMQIVEDADDIEEMAIASVKNKQGKKVEWNSVGGHHMVHVDGKPAHSGFLDHKSAAKLYNTVKEEVDNETFTKEVEAQKEKDSGKNKKADIAAASVQAVKNEEVEQVEERTLTEPEMDKREKVVKSMKKNLAGFKERYGKRGKEVLYATATKIAKGEK